MINLLPTDTKNRVAFARRNTVMRSWVIATLIGVAGIILVLAAGVWFINRSSASVQWQVNQNKEQLKAQKLDETQKRVAEISDSVKLASQVLSKQVLFSKLLTQVAAAMPAGASLQSLSINSTQGGIDLTAVATNYESATQVQVNLADPDNKLFDKADIVTVLCQTADKPTAYPCQVTIRALFTKNNTFQYSTSQGVKNEQ